MLLIELHSAEGLGVAFAPHAAKLNMAQGRPSWRLTARRFYCGSAKARRWCSQTSFSSVHGALEAILIRSRSVGQPMQRRCVSVFLVFLVFDDGPNRRLRMQQR